MMPKWIGSDYVGSDYSGSLGPWGMREGDDEVVYNYDHVKVSHKLFERLWKALNTTSDSAKPKSGTKAELSLKIDKLEAENAQHKSSLESVKAELSRVELERNHLTVKLAEADKSSTAQRADLDRIKQELAAAKQELAKYACNTDGKSRFQLLELD